MDKKRVLFFKKNFFVFMAFCHQDACYQFDLKDKKYKTTFAFELNWKALFSLFWMKIVSVLMAGK